MTFKLGGNKKAPPVGEALTCSVDSWKFWNLLRIKRDGRHSYF